MRECRSQFSFQARYQLFRVLSERNGCGSTLRNSVRDSPIFLFTSIPHRCRCRARQWKPLVRWIVCRNSSRLLSQTDTRLRSCGRYKRCRNDSELWVSSRGTIRRDRATNLSPSPRSGGDKYDVAVVGGGPAGAAAVLELANNGLRAILLESQPSPTCKIGETLPPEARLVLRSIGVWEMFLRDGQLPSAGICSSWGSSEVAERDFIFNPHGCGWQLDRAKFEGLLLRAAKKRGATVLQGETVRGLRRVEGIWIIELNSRSVLASWVVDASGRRAAIARRMDVIRIILDQLVSISTIAPSGEKIESDNRTFIEARPDGWWYSALLPDGRRMLAFQTDAEFVKGQQWRDPRWFRTKLAETEHLSTLLESEGSRTDGTCYLTSAHSGRLYRCFGEGWVAAGDAAQSYDPLSGQGILSALTSGQQAGRALSSDGPKISQALLTYCAAMESRWKRFLQQRRHFYAMEQRFGHSPFWQTRAVTVRHGSQ